MQGINRLGQMVLAGLIGSLIGVLVIASWASPAATSAGLSPSEQARVGANAVVAADSASQGRIPHGVLTAKQSIEAESYPARIADVSVNTAAQIIGPLDLHEALWAKQQIEAEYYPGRNASLSAGKDNAETQTLHDVLAEKQRVEAEYYPVQITAANVLHSTIQHTTGGWDYHFDSVKNRWIGTHYTIAFTGSGIDEVVELENLP